jgi:hypothetical protein
MKAFFTLVLVAIIVTAWCPWFKAGEARQLIANKVRESQSTLQTGCILKIDTLSLQQIPFGYIETVAYNCTFNTDFLTEGKNTVFVPFFKQVTNVPHPIIK